MTRHVSGMPVAVLQRTPFMQLLLLQLPLLVQRRTATC